MAWSDAARRAALEARRAHGKASNKYTPPANRLGRGENAIQSHPNYNATDYKYLKEKGYSDKEIRTIWDRDKARGDNPQTHANRAPARPTSHDRTLKALFNRSRHELNLDKARAFAKSARMSKKETAAYMERVAATLKKSERF